MIKPKGLAKGDTIGVIAPASPSEKKSEVVRAKEFIEDLGYKVVLGKNVNKLKGFVAATEEERASDFNEMFRRDDIDAVFVTQGGYGTAQLLNLLDFKLVKENPKIFTGFSDITSLHLMLNKFCELTTFHGPGMARFNKEDLTDYTKKYFFKAVSQEEPIGKIELADNKKWLNSISDLTAEGEIIGGNLTLICSSLGTPYEIDCKDKLLLIEEVDAEPWIFDHMMCHLRNAGKLNDAKGFIIGECSNCVPNKFEPGYLSDTGVEDILDYYLSPLGKPALYGLPLGHTEDLATVPLGVHARVDCSKKTFEILESGINYR